MAVCRGRICAGYGTTSRMRCRPGPGVIKLPSGLAEAYTTAVHLSRSPVTYLGSSNDIAGTLRRRKDFAIRWILLRPVSKAVIRVQSQIDLRDGINRAFAEATTGRPGPVVLNIPADVMQADWYPLTLPVNADDRFAISQRRASGPMPTRCIVQPSSRQGKTTCHSGRRRRSPIPRIVAGQRAAGTVRSSCGKHGNGKGIIDERHPLSVGVLGGQYGEPGANNVVKEADLVFLIGFKSSQQSTYAWNLPRPDQTVIHLDIDPFEVAEVFPTEVCLIGDAASGLMDLIAAGDTLGFKPMCNEWLEREPTCAINLRELATREAVDRGIHHKTLCGSLSAGRTPMIFW